MGNLSVKMNPCFVCPASLFFGVCVAVKRCAVVVVVAVLMLVRCLQAALLGFAVDQKFVRVVSQFFTSLPIVHNCPPEEVEELQVKLQNDKEPRSSFVKSLHHLS